MFAFSTGYVTSVSEIIDEFLHEGNRLAAFITLAGGVKATAPVGSEAAFGLGQGHTTPSKTS